MFKVLFSHFDTVPAKVTVDKESERTHIELRIYNSEPLILMKDLPPAIQAAADWCIECFIDGRFWTIEGGHGEVTNLTYEGFPGIDIRTKIFGRA
jgi:hypothetical protein